MTISQFDRTAVRLLAADLEAAVKAVAAKHGLAVERRGGSFSSTSYTPKFEFSVIGADGSAETTDVANFKRYANMFGLQPTDLGRVFAHQGTAFTICGLRPGARKNPILAKRHDGKAFVFPARVVRDMLGGAKAS